MPIRAVIQRKQWLNDSMVRVVLGEGDLARFTPSPAADSYIKLIFQHPDAPFVNNLNLDLIRAQLPTEQWPRLRAYTVRNWDDAATELTLDVIVHHQLFGDRPEPSGVAGRWAATAQPGDAIHLTGPGGSYLPAPDATWYLLAGDESALPAITVAATRLPRHIPTWAFVEVQDPTSHIPLPPAAAKTITWLHRNGQGEQRDPHSGTSQGGPKQHHTTGSALVDAIADLNPPTGIGQAFIHGEAGVVRDLRRMLRTRWGLTPQQLHASGYWRLGADDEGWRASKPLWNQHIARDDHDIDAANPGG